MTLSNTGEVADFRDADQFQWRAGHPLTQFACGYYACALLKAMAPVGQAPTQSVAQIIAEADQWYVEYDGDDSGSNTAGMTLNQLYALLKQIKLVYTPLARDIGVVKAWVQKGYPVVLAVEETSVRDLTPGMNGANPYPWTPAGSHIIDITGVTADGNVLARDTANCTNLYDPNSLRAGPRKYDASALSIVSATAVTPPWLGGNAMQLYSTNAHDFPQWFKATDSTHWLCPKYNTTIQLGLLILYCQLSIDGNTLPIVGLPVTNELYVQVPDKAGVQRQVAITVCERAALIYDEFHVVDSQPGFGAGYLMKLDDPRLLKLIPGLQLPTVAQVPEAVLAAIKAVMTDSLALAKAAGMAS